MANNAGNKAKKVISGIARTTGKYTLKGIGKGLEIAGTGGVRTIHAIARNRGLQKIVTGAGILAAGVMIPTVGIGLISAVGAKYLYDRTITNKHWKSIMDEINDIVEMGTRVTRGVTRSIISPVLDGAEAGIHKSGKKFQDFVDDKFSR